MERDGEAWRRSRRSRRLDRRGVYIFRSLELFRRRTPPVASRRALVPTRLSRTGTASSVLHSSLTPRASAAHFFAFFFLDLSGVAMSALRSSSVSSRSDWMGWEVQVVILSLPFFMTSTVALKCATASPGFS